MSRRVLKWTVPVDDHDHPIGSGPVLLVGCQNDRHDLVQVWTDEQVAESVTFRSARVYGTGQPVPGVDEALGSVIVGPLVWHVFAARRPTGPHAVEAGR